MLKIKLIILVFVTIILSSCTPVDTPDAVMFTTQKSDAMEYKG